MAEGPSTRRLRILAPLINPLSFVLADVAALEARHEVTRIRCVRPLEMLRTALEIRRHDLLFCWFGSYRFLPAILVARLLGRKVLLIGGGYDVAAEPSIGYGNMRRPLGRLVGRVIFRLANVVSSYSEAGAADIATNAGISRSAQRMIFLGFDADTWGRDIPLSAKTPMVVTVGRIDMSTIHRKGMLTLARASRLLPEFPFVLAGKFDPDALDALTREAGPNVSFPGFLNDDELKDLLSRARVYAQPSVHEAFGCAVAEAMLFNCVPVVSRRHSLPEVVGETGLYVEPDDTEDLARQLRRALVEEWPGGPPRSRIARLFPAGTRREALLAVAAEMGGVK
jgi:glycosyltransferase involved in cell wall biosynthesis